MRIPMYSMMGGAPVGCSPRIKGGVPGRAIIKFLPLSSRSLLHILSLHGPVLPPTADAGPG